MLWSFCPSPVGAPGAAGSAAHHGCPCRVATPGVCKTLINTVHWVLTVLGTSCSISFIRTEEGVFPLTSVNVSKVRYKRSVLE